MHNHIVDKVAKFQDVDIITAIKLATQKKAKVSILDVCDKSRLSKNLTWNRPMLTCMVSISELGSKTLTQCF